MMEPAPVDPMTPPPSARPEACDGGEVVTWQPRADIGVHQVHGTLSLPLARLITDFYGPMVYIGARVKMFGDLQHVSRYTREARELLTRFVVEHRDGIEVIHTLYGSKVVAMGVSAFKHGVHGTPVHTYWDRTSFARSFAEAMRSGK
jgi:hypothetical protein